MEVQSAFNSGVQGFQKATEDANKAAASIVANTTESLENFDDGELTAKGENLSSGNLTNLNESVVNLKVAEYQAKASVEVIKSADETLGTLLDVRV